MPHAFFNLPCPWPGCGFVAYLIDFRLEAIDLSLYARGVAAWNSGHALIGPCPVCGRLVGFSIHGLHQDVVSQRDAGSVVLPDDWFQHAVIVDKDGKQMTF